jgi:hypothetical protein
MFKKIIYVVHMLRYGSVENHSYILGAFKNYSLAYNAAESEACDRGGKYEYEIIETELNNPDNTFLGRSFKWKMYREGTKIKKNYNDVCNRMCSDDKCNVKKYLDKVYKEKLEEE